MTKRIFISTDANLHGTFGGRSDTDFQTKLNISNLSLLNNNDIVYYNGTVFDTTSTGSSIIIVKDLSTTKLTGINANTDFLLHHKKTDSHVTNVVNNFEGQKVLGQHPDKYYKDVFKIIFDDTINNKAQRIIEFLFPTADTILGKKLDLLHSLLVPPVDFADAKEQWKKIKEAVDEARTRGVVVSFPADVLPLTDFETAVSNITGAFDKALTKLRDTLLV